MGTFSIWHWAVLLIPLVLFLPGIVWAVNSSRSNPVYGVGGWLAILIYSLYVLVPLYNLLTTASVIGMAERENPQLLQVDSWMTFRTSTWVANAGMSVFSVFTAYCLHIRPVPSSLRLAKGYMWSVPVVALVMAWVMDLTLHVPPAEQVGRVMGAAAIAGLWHAYLSMSLRVSGTYKPTDEGGRSDEPTRPSARSTVRPTSPEPGYPASDSAQGQPRFDDDDLFEVVGNELRSGNPVAGTWTRAFAEADGDENKARALYIRLRVERLKLERKERGKAAPH